jgi:hypothetical protein
MTLGRLVGPIDQRIDERVFAEAPCQGRFQPGAQNQPLSNCGETSATARLLCKSQSQTQGGVFAVTLRG